MLFPNILIRELFFFAQHTKYKKTSALVSGESDFYFECLNTFIKR